MRGRVRVSFHLVPVLGLVGLAALALLAAACGGTSKAAAIPSGERTIFLTAQEYKGGTEVSKEPFPTAKLPDGGAYGLKDPSGDPLRWEVNSYAWAPSSFTVVEGDKVTLKIIGVNGAQHVSSIEGHVEQFTVKRGQITTVTFTAGKPGVYRLTCSSHMPSMVGQMLVLPAKS